MLLVDTCQILSGYTARARLDPVERGGIPALQLKDAAADGLPDPARLARIELEGDFSRYLVRCGDVVFRSRGERNTAVVLDERFGDPVVVVLPLMVLRPVLNVVDPGYLAWAINQPAAQRHFDNDARGTSMRMVPRSSLGTLAIDVPDLATQRTIVAADALADRERDLTVRAAELRRQLSALVLANRAKSMGLGNGRKGEMK